MYDSDNYLFKVRKLYIQLEKTKNLELIKTVVTNISDNNRYIEIKVFFSLFELLDNDVNFATECINKPLKLIEILQEVAASSYDVIKKSTSAMKSSRFYINLKYTDVPPIYSLILKRPEQILSCGNNIITFFGFVYSMTTGSKFTRSCVLQCQDKTCREKNNTRVCVFYPEFPDSQSDKRNTNCECGFVMNERINERIEEELVEFSVLLTFGDYGVNRVVPCVTRGSLCKMLQIGKKFCFIGFPVSKGSLCDMRLTIEINNILDTDWSSCSVEHLSWMNLWRYIPTDIANYEFGPSFMMAFMFADEVTPAGSFFFLKLLLMLLLLSNTAEDHLGLDTSLLGVEELRYRPISLLIAPEDTNIVSKIIDVAKCYSSNFWVHSSQDMLLGHVLKVDDTVSTEIGTLLLPDNYVAFLPHLALLTNKSQSQLKRVLQDRLVQPICRRDTVMFQEPLCCKVWAVIDLGAISHSQVSGISDSTKSLYQAFDLICTVEDPAGEHWEQAMAKCILERSLGRVASSGDEYHQLYHSFLHNAARIMVTQWTHQAVLFIRGYYIIGRKITTKASVVFPQSALSVLLQLATNLAKLNNRSIINPCDSLLAIYIYEVLYSSKLGHTLLGLPDCHYTQLAHVPSIDNGFLEQFLNIMALMQTNLIELIKSNLDPIFLEE